MIIRNLVNGERIDLKLREKFEAIPEKGYVPKLIYDIVLKDSGVVIGECDARIGQNENTYYGGNIGYSIFEQYRGNGYATEAVKLLLNIFKDNNMKEVYVTNDVSNYASKRVCEKSGGEFLGIKELPQDSELRKDGETHVNIFLIKIN